MIAEKNQIEVEDIASMLHNIRLFRNSTLDDVQKLAQRGFQVDIKKGDEIIKQGGNEQTAYLIVSGSVDIYRDEIKMARYEAGQLFGEFSMLDGSSYSAGAKGLEDTTLFSISREDFLVQLEESSSLAISIIETLSKRLRRHL